MKARKSMLKHEFLKMGCQPCTSIPSATLLPHAIAMHAIYYYFFLSFCVA